jgi:hypothetical protein
MRLPEESDKFEASMTSSTGLNVVADDCFKLLLLLTQQQRFCSKDIVEQQHAPLISLLLD